MNMVSIVKRINFALCRRFPSFNKLIHQSINVFDAGNGNIIKIHPSCIFSKLKVVIRGNNNNIIIEKKCKLGPRSLIYITGDNNCLIIGEGSMFSGETRFVLEEGKSINIGKNCLFGVQVCLRTSDGHPIFGEHGERINYPDNIIIDDHVWVGQRATILKGVSIGSNSMIGTMSLVTKSFGCNSMIAGVPAKMIKNGINWRFELYD